MLTYQIEEKETGDIPEVYGESVDNLEEEELHKNLRHMRLSPRYDLGEYVVRIEGREGYTLANSKLRNLQQASK